MRLPWKRSRADDEWEDTIAENLVALHASTQSMEWNIQAMKELGDSLERRLNALEKVIEDLEARLDKASNDIRALGLKVK